MNGSDCLIHKALRKHGIENFSIEQVDTASSIEELRQKEIYYIKKYNTYYLWEDSNGYNMTMGGEENTHLIGELSPVSKNTDAQRMQIIELLKNTKLTFKEIALQVKVNTNDGEKLVSQINTGENFHQENLDYPIRKNAKSIAKQGELNPSADLKRAKEIIRLLSTTDLSQSQIAQKCDAHINTVNDINRCIRWTELHSYKNNIREESGIKTKTKQQIKMEEKAKNIIKMLEDQCTYSLISKTLSTNLNMVCDINFCRKYAYLHNYKNNIREESRGDV